MKIAIIGYGKMGKTIEKLAQEQGHEIVLKISSANKADFTIANIKAADVAIEFSRPETAYDNIMTCLQAGVPVVSGTTAWLEDYPKVEAYCKENSVGFFYASNFSVGVNIFFEINRKLAQLMGSQEQYDIKMEEIHHTQKLDAPSGTAISIFEGIQAEIPSCADWTLAEQENVEGNRSELPIVAKRIGTVPGTHIVEYESSVDKIEIKHEAKGRIGFASGAILAAQWIIGKHGVFGMRDLLKL